MSQEIIQIDLGGVNCYLLKSDTGFILVDTGGHLVMDKVFTNRIVLLEQALEKHGCHSENLKLILLTHGDNDHTCNAAYLRDKYKTKIALHKDDWYLVQQPTLDDWMESFRYRSILFKIIFKIMKTTIRRVTIKMMEDYKTFTPDISIDQQFDLHPLGFDGTVIHMPGHTPGSIGILTKNGDLIVGDTFSNMKKSEIAPNALDFKLLHKSIADLKSYPINRIYPGHGTPFDFQDLLLFPF